MNKICVTDSYTGARLRLTGNSPASAGLGRVRSSDSAGSWVIHNWQCVLGTVDCHTNQVTTTQVPLSIRVELWELRFPHTTMALATAQMEETVSP